MNRFYPALAGVALTLAAVGAPAQDLLISNATLHTMTSDGIVEGADILIKNGRITRIADTIAADDGITVIDAAGRPVTPALFAGVTVAGLDDVSAVSESVDSAIEELFTDIMHPEFDVRVAYNPHSSVIPVTRIEGFGYSLLAATHGDHSIAGRGGLVRFDGGYDSFEGVPVVFVDIDGHSADDVGGSRAAHWMLLRQAFAEADGDEDDLELISKAGRAALNTARRDGVFVFDANRASDIMQVLRFAREQKLRVAIHGGREAWMVADALADAKVPVFINALDNLPADFDSLGARLDNAALLEAAGITVLFSSGETHNARKVRQVAGNAVANGMTHAGALAALTRAPAEVFGGSPRTATEGELADLVIWSGDPLEVTTGADQVIMGGVADPMVSRQTLLRDRYLPRSPDLPRAYIKP